MIWQLDTGNDGNDELLIGPTRESVELDVLHHYDLDELPSHWTLEICYNPTPTQFVADYYTAPESWLIAAADYAMHSPELTELFNDLIDICGLDINGGDVDAYAVERAYQRLKAAYGESLQ